VALHPNTNWVRDEYCYYFKLSVSEPHSDHIIEHVGEILPLLTLQKKKNDSANKRSKSPPKGGSPPTSSTGKK
jgi:hypothetical protein